jgi:hypothetical protein
LSLSTEESKLPKDEYRTISAIVMLGDLNLPNDDALGRTIQTRLPDVPIPASSSKSGPLLFVTQEAICTVMTVAAPCPISQQDSAVMTAWHWPQAWENVEHHKAHIIVSVSSDGDPRVKMKLFGQLTAAAVEASPMAMGVHCSSADVLWPASVLPPMVSARGADLPLPLCVSVKLSHNIDKRTLLPTGTISGMTKGLSAFGLMEIETHGYDPDPQALNGLLLDLASYLIKAGPVVKDGDRIGPDETTKITVRHEHSGFVQGQSVYRLYFSEPNHGTNSAS